MPPKKKTAAPAKAKSTRTTGRAVPDTITNNRGTEIETTAAARRATRGVVAPDYNPKPVYATLTATDTANTSRKRATATAVQEDAPKKRGPGRPPKSATTKTAATNSAASKTATISEPVKRGRGRPPKAPRAGTAKKALRTTTAAPPPSKGTATAATPTGRKRGRPSKADVAAETAGPPKKRGRPSNASKAAAPAVPLNEDDTPAPKKRGRPPKGGETTKIDTDDAAAAEQLEEELEDTAIDPGEGSSNRQASAPFKGKGAKVKKTTNNDDNVEQVREQTKSGINYWLLKAEQDGHDMTLADGTVVNSTFTIDDLRSKTEPEPWDGVRSVNAAMNIRNMRAGDMAFFYASGGKQGRKPGITGIVEIVSEVEPDGTMTNPNSSGYVAKEADRKKWVQVRVEFRKKLSKPVHLSELQQFKDGALKDMQELNAARLSVSKVREKEWDFINTLIEGFEGDGNAGYLDSELEAQVAGPSVVAAAEENTITEQANGDIVDDGAVDHMEKDFDLPNGIAPPTIMQSTEPELPTTDTIFPEATSATARPASRAGSRHSSRAPSATGSKLGVSSRPASRAGSLAPPTGRGRSRTPGARASSVGALPGATDEASGLLESVLETDEAGF